MSRKLKKLKQYPNLVFTEETLDGFSHPALSQQGTAKLLEALSLLNEYGTSRDVLGKRLENMGREKFWSLKVKDVSNNEWRIMFKRIDKPGDLPVDLRANYAMIYMFRKTTLQVTKRDFDAAKRIAKREGL